MMTEEQVKELKGLRYSFVIWYQALENPEIPIPSYEGEKDAYPTEEIREYAKEALSFCYGAQLEAEKVCYLLDELIKEETGETTIGYMW